MQKLIFAFSRSFRYNHKMAIEIRNYIEHTILKPEATSQEVKKVVQEAIDNRFLGVCVNPNFVALAHDTIELSASHKPKIVTVVNFPLGANKVETTVAQTKQAIEEGADEIDTVINLGALKAGDYEKVGSDIQKTKEACGTKPLKVILETDLLTKDEITKACKICVGAEADFVKTSTGFVKGGVGAKVEDVALMYGIVHPFGLNVKASGGIKTKEQALALIEAGATRLGASSGIELIK